MLPAGHNVTARPGQAVVYEGARLPHGRLHPLPPGGLQCSIFAHWTLQDQQDFDVRKHCRLEDDFMATHNSPSPPTLELAAAAANDGVGRDGGRSAAEL